MKCGNWIYDNRGDLEGCSGEPGLHHAPRMQSELGSHFHYEIPRNLCEDCSQSLQRRARRLRFLASGYKSRCSK